MNPGDTIFLRTTDVQIAPHCHALYLGKDDSGDAKVLIPSFTDGFSIIRLSELDSSSYRVEGRCNLRGEEFTDDGPMFFKYVFFDIEPGTNRFNEILVSVVNRGEWEITEQSDTPNWLEA